MNIGVWLFDTRFAQVSLSLALIDRLADIPNVCGIKVGRDHDRYLEVLQRVGDRILVCEPNEGTWLENMRDHGQRVFMSSAAPYLYQVPGWRPMRDYTELALAGELAGRLRWRPRWSRCGRWRPPGCTARRPAGAASGALHQGLGGAARHVRRPGPAAAGPGPPGRPGGPGR